MSFDKFKDNLTSNIISLLVGILGTGAILLFSNLITPRGEFLLLRSQFDAHIQVTHAKLDNQAAANNVEDARRDLVLEGLLRAYCFESSKPSLEASGLIIHCEAVGIRK